MLITSVLAKRVNRANTATYHIEQRIVNRVQKDNFLRCPQQQNNVKYAPKVIVSLIRPVPIAIHVSRTFVLFFSSFFLSMDFYFNDSLSFISVCSGEFQAATSMETCSECPVGKFTKEVVQTYCIDCPSGFYQPSTESASCLPCMPGKSSLLDGASSCEECVVGRFIPDIESNATCSDCPEGFYVNKAASSLCLACPAGRFQTDAGSTDCDKCSVGFFSPAAESTSCIACPLGYMQPLEDSVGCSVCGAGQEGINTIEGCAPVSFHVLYCCSLIRLRSIADFFMLFWIC